jgi:hypothetical protein
VELALPAIVRDFDGKKKEGRQVNPVALLFCLRAALRSHCVQPCLLEQGVLPQSLECHIGNLFDPLP